MSYSEPLVNQIRVFFLSIGVGVVVCLLYIAVQGFFRFFGKSSRVYYFADGVFCVLFAFVSFFFMVLYNNGRVRLHLVLGEAAGFFVFYLAVGRFMLEMLFKAAETARRVTDLVLLPVRSVGRHFVAGLKELRPKSSDKSAQESPGGDREQKKTKKIKFLDKIHLKNKNKSV